MFEKLIINLKKSLPEALRKRMGEEDTSEDDNEFEEFKNDSDEESEDDLKEEKSKKMKSMIIKVIVIIGLGYFALDEFVLKGTQEQAETDTSIQKPKTKIKKVVEADASTNELPPTEEESIEPTGTSPASVEEETPTAQADESVVSEEAPIENINVLEKTEEIAPVAPVEKIVDETPAPLEEEVISQTTMGESNIDQKLDDLVDNVEQFAPSNPMEEIKIPSMGESATPPSMASKITEVVIETPPPVYDQVGRGLVYNCKDKFWACLDKPAYITCSKNQKWNNSKGNSVECVVADIYSSDEDCAKVQKHNVSTSAATAFCQN